MQGTEEEEGEEGGEGEEDPGISISVLKPWHACDCDRNGNGHGHGNKPW